jgi:purine catabolism regulator
MRISAITGLLPGEHGLAIVVALHSAGDRREIAGRISRTLHRASENSLAGARLVVCVGPVSRSWAEVGAALRDAFEMSQAVSHNPSHEWFDSTEPSIERLLWALRGEAPLRAFVERRLGTIARHDREHRTQFLQTLESYCVHGGRIAETARDLHLQRQSLYKRITRIEELLGGDLSDPDTRLGLHFALRARSYLEALELGAPTGSRG